MRKFTINCADLFSVRKIGSKPSDVDWKNTSVVTKECSLRQRKVKEGIESLREIHRGTNVLNSFESLTVWTPILNKYFDSENSAHARVRFSLKIGLRITNVKLVCMRQHCKL